jgi:hypothetical protein
MGFSAAIFVSLKASDFLMNNDQLTSQQVPSNMNVDMIMFDIGFGSYDFILFPLMITVIL